MWTNGKKNSKKIDTNTDTNYISERVKTSKKKTINFKILNDAKM